MRVSGRRVFNPAKAVIIRCQTTANAVYTAQFIEIYILKRDWVG
jgi:hypothetical protein